MPVGLRATHMGGQQCVLLPRAPDRSPCGYFGSQDLIVCTGSPRAAGRCWSPPRWRGRRSSIIDPRSSIIDPRSSVHDPRSSMVDPRSSLLDARSSGYVHNPPTTQSVTLSTCKWTDLRTELWACCGRNSRVDHRASTIDDRSIDGRSSVIDHQSSIDER